VLTADPAEEDPCPVLEMAFCEALTAELFASALPDDDEALADDPVLALDVSSVPLADICVLAVAVALVTVPGDRLVVWVPVAAAPEVLI